MIRTFFASCGLLALLSACVSDSSGDLSRAPSVDLVTVDRQLQLHATASASSHRQLRSLIAEVAQGDVSAVHASIVVTGAADAEPWRRALIRFGVDPGRIAMAIDPRQPASILLTRTAAVPEDCGETVNPALADDQLPSLEGLGRCIQNNNLAAMLVHPSDLVAPQALGRGDGAHLAGGVSDWRSNRQGKPQAGGGSASADGSSGSSSSSSSTAPAGGKGAAPAAAQ
jgi:type IV pilus biogenesis protein CpaD/CtpE